MQYNNGNAPGITCPNDSCREKFSVSLQDLLFSPSIQCPHCLCLLTMNREKSRDTITAMDKLYTAIKNAETAKKYEGNKTRR